MLPSIFAWIGIVLVSIWTIFYIIGTLQLLAQYRKIKIENQEPTNSLSVSSCIMVVSGLLSIPLYILILSLNFKIEMFLVLLLTLAFFVIDAIVQGKKKKRIPETTSEDTEKQIQEMENAPKRDTVFTVSALVIVTTIFRLLPFVVYLLVK